MCEYRASSATFPRNYCPRLLFVNVALHEFATNQYLEGPLISETVLRCVFNPGLLKIAELSN
jgi:hypothetical protein